MFRKTAEPEPEPDSQMEQLKGLQAELAGLKKRFQDIRDETKKIDETAELADRFIFTNTTILLKRAEKEIDQTEKDDIEENTRLQAKLKSKFAKKAKAKPKLTRTEALIEKAREQGS